MGKEFTSLVNTEANKRSRYYFSTLTTDMVAFLAAYQLQLRGTLTHLKAKTKRKMDSV